MKQFLPCGIAAKRHMGNSSSILLAVLFLIAIPSLAPAQAVTAIVTDYNGFYRTSAASPNPVRPSNNHNLLAFTYKGVQYSTGADDVRLNANGETFSAQDFWALPVEGITGAINSNTKVGVGQLYDGVPGGGSDPPPVNDIALYLTDGTKGLNIGTCIANLPSGAMTFFVNDINPAAIGDGIPDILVTQIADPSGSFDRYEFTDDDNVRIGNYLDIVFTNITPVGTWTADFYEASRHPMILTPGFTNTDRPVRLWAADLSEFGITAANYQSIRRFKINLSGQSDVAFAAYNNKSIRLANPLPVRLTGFSGHVEERKNMLTWNTQTETENAYFTIERSTDETNFYAIGTIAGAGNSATFRQYSFADATPGNGKNFYRLKMTSTEGKHSFSPVILLRRDANAAIQVFPNPSSGAFVITHPRARGTELVTMVNNAGHRLLTQRPGSNQYQTQVDASRLPKGLYYLIWNEEGTQWVRAVVIR